ncbi:hypothetical protein LN378_28135, partial [Enterobacter hormaechei subsp. steigerwaltii]|nr:hypothetical protein [Enterobacter hormaechei subsp. steigerwaltii]
MPSETQKAQTTAALPVYLAGQGFGKYFKPTPNQNRYSYAALSAFPPLLKQAFPHKSDCFIFCHIFQRFRQR